MKSAGRNIKDLDKFDPRTLAALAKYRHTVDRKRMTLPEIVDCLKVPAFSAHLKGWIEGHVSELLAIDIQFIDDQALRRFLTPDAGSAALVDPIALLDQAFLEQLEPRPALLLSKVLRPLLFSTWNEYSQCVAARLAYPVYMDAPLRWQAPTRAVKWKHLFRAAFKGHRSHPWTDRRLTMMASAGRKYLERRRRSLDFRLVLVQPTRPQAPRGSTRVNGLVWAEAISIDGRGKDPAMITNSRPAQPTDWHRKPMFAPK